MYTYIEHIEYIAYNRICISIYMCIVCIYIYTSYLSICINYIEWEYSKLYHVITFYIVLYHIMS